MVSAFRGGDQLILPGLENELSRHGLCLEVSYAPGNRATVLLRQGQIDGELFRVSEYQEEIGSAGIRVPVAIFEAYGLLVTQSEDLLALESLSGQSVAVLRGTIWPQRVLPPHVSAVEVDAYDAAFAMLATGRVAGVMIDTVSLMQFDQQSQGLVSRRVTAKSSAFAYLHKRHRLLVPTLEQAIRDWKDGFTTEVDGL